MEKLTHSEIMSQLRREFKLLDIDKIKITTKAYGWSDDTLLMYREENDKYMFHMCVGIRGNVVQKRRFIYLIKPHSFDHEFTHYPKIKIPLDHNKVITYIDPYYKPLNDRIVYDTKIKLNNAIKEIDSLISNIYD